MLIWKCCNSGVKSQFSWLLWTYSSSILSSTLVSLPSSKIGNIADEIIAQSTCRALVVDALPVSEQKLGAAWGKKPVPFLPSYILERRDSGMR